MSSSTGKMNVDVCGQVPSPLHSSEQVGVFGCYCMPSPVVSTFFVFPSIFEKVVVTFRSCGDRPMWMLVCA